MAYSKTSIVYIGTGSSAGYVMVQDMRGTCVLSLCGWLSLGIAGTCSLNQSNEGLCDTDDV